MAECYLFNKSIKRKSSSWLWLFGFIAIFMASMVYVAPASALEPVLYNPSDDNTPTRITGIDFTREANNTGVALVTFEGGTPTPQLVESQGKVTITLADSVLDEGQLVELNVTEFSTSVSTIETFQDEKSTRIEIRYSDTVTARHAIDDNIIRIKIEPMSLSQQEELENKKTYTGDPISLDFQDVPVRQVLQIIAQVNGFNLVTTDTVTGNVTISLSGVPWDQALDMILRVKGLDKRLEGNILLIAPIEELTARETQALQSQKQVSDLAPLSTVNISVNYAPTPCLLEILCHLLMKPEK